MMSVFPSGKKEKNKALFPSTCLRGKDQMESRAHNQPATEARSFHPLPCPKGSTLDPVQEGSFVLNPSSQTAKSKLGKVRNFGKALQSWHIFQTVLKVRASGKHYPCLPPALAPSDPVICTSQCRAGLHDSKLEC